MALDFHIAKTREEAKYNARIFGVEIEEHNVIFHVIEKTACSYPVLQRFGDFFSDAVVSPSEAASLIADINRYIGNANSPGFRSRFLENLANTANISIEKGDNIYAFCD